MAISQIYDTFRELKPSNIYYYLDDELGLYEKYIEPINIELLKKGGDNDSIDRINILFRLILWDELFYGKYEFDETKLLGEYNRRKFVSSLLYIMDNPNKYAISYHTLNLICERWPQIKNLISSGQQARRDMEESKKCSNSTLLKSNLPVIQWDNLPDSNLEQSSNVLLDEEKPYEEICSADSNTTEETIEKIDKTIEQHESPEEMRNQSAERHYSCGLKYKYNNADFTAEVSGIEKIAQTRGRRILIPPHTYHHGKKYAVIGVKNNAFENINDLWSLILPNSIIYIGDSAFRHCENLVSVDMQENIKSIGCRAFEKCGCLKSITIPNSVMRIGYSAFMECLNLTNVILPNNITNIEESVFKECRSLSSINIPHTVTHIDRYAFFLCGNLEHITISNTIRRIGFEAFLGCNKLLQVTIPASTTLEYGSFPPTCVVIKK